MRRFYHLVIIGVVFVLSAKAQENDYVLKPPRHYDKQPAKNAVFIELGGNAGLYSLNFDRIYWYTKNIKASARIGFSAEPHGYFFEQVYVFEQNVILFKNPHHLELGGGVTTQRRYNEKPNSPDHYFWENIWFSVWRCGYRYQKQDDGLFLRTALTPVVMSHDALGYHLNYFQFWLGLSIGVSF